MFNIVYMVVEDMGMFETIGQRCHENVSHMTG